MQVLFPQTAPGTNHPTQEDKPGVLVTTQMFGVPHTSPDTTYARALAVASLFCAAVVFTSAVREFRP